MQRNSLFPEIDEQHQQTFRELESIIANDPIVSAEIEAVIEETRKFLNSPEILEFMSKTNYQKPTTPSNVEATTNTNKPR